MKKLSQESPSALSENKNKIVIVDNASITNDPVGFLAYHSEFFLPEFKKIIPLHRLITHIFLWIIFFNLLLVLHIHNTSNFLSYIVKDFLHLTLTILPSIVIVDSYRDYFKSLPTWQTFVRIILIFSSVSIMVLLLIDIAISFLFAKQVDIVEMFYDILIHTANVSIMTFLILSYYLRRSVELSKIKDSFELNLATQNEIFNARMSPHFFFNTLNGLTSLVESDPKQAVEMLENISTLFRASFDNSEEISMDEEIVLCQVFLKIDDMRFHGKLNITWDLPDEDIIYDMVITGLTLQTVLEKFLHHIVELTTENININIAISWEHHIISIDIHAELPAKTLLIYHDLEPKINFDIQEQSLKKYFGEQSEIEEVIAKNKIIISITYPLHDSGLDMMSPHTDIDDELYIPLPKQNNLDL